MKISNYDSEDGNLFYCPDCFADTEHDCICYKIIGCDAITGFPVVDNEETDDSREWALFWE
jgi:hypothetical protein